jgi:hypothetical protein
MIKGFEPPHPAEPVQKHRLQAIPAAIAGLIAGAVMLIVPHASPWEGLTTFTPAVIGRVLPMSWGVPGAGVVALHLALSVIYGFIISLVVINIHELRAVFIGGLVGLGLYLINFGIVSAWLPALRGNEVSVIITHGVFGLIAAGAYRGLLRRKVPTA